MLNILDLSGREIMNEKFSGNRITINRGNLKTGLYILKISTENNNQQFSSKLSIQ